MGVLGTRSQSVLASGVGLLLLMATAIPIVSTANGQSGADCVGYPGSPVLTGGSNSSWDGGGVESPSVVYSGSNFSMFYTGESTDYTPEIGLATSTDGVNWTKHLAPVLETGGNGTWDSQAVYFPAVISNGTGYLMYYTGYNQTTIGIGVAFSKDLVHWQKYAGNPVLLPGPGGYDSVSLTSHTVMFDPPLYKMWYSGRYPVNYTHSIGYATSDDGLHWTKYAGNPVITRSTNNDSYIFGPWGPSVVKVDSGYFAAYETDGLISSATSPDGVHWTASATPLLRSSNPSPNSGYIVESPWMMPVNSSVYMWYTGISDAGPRPYWIGFAFCALTPLVTTATVTSVSTTTLATTIVSQVTVYETSTTTEQASTAALTLYQASTALLAALLVITLAAAFAKLRRVT